MFVDFNILNQLGSPSINSNTFANRPAAGQTGRLFVSTDTFEIYRDNGTGWDLIGGPGSSTVTGSGATGQVTYWTGTNTVSGENALFWDAANNRLGINTATPTAHLDVHSAADVAMQLNGTGATPTVLQQFLSAGVAQYELGYNWNASADYRRFSIYDVVGAKEVISIDQQSRYVGINYQYSSLSDQPAYTLDVSGSLRITDSVYLATAANNRVGIGTTSPQYPFDVVVPNTTPIAIVTTRENANGPSYFVGRCIGGTYASPTDQATFGAIFQSYGYRNGAYKEQGYLTFTGINASSGNGIAGSWNLFLTNDSSVLSQIAQATATSFNIGGNLTQTTDTFQVTGRTTLTRDNGLTASISNTVTSGSGLTGYGLIIVSEASASTSYALHLINSTGSVSYGGVSTATGQVGYWSIGFAATGTIGNRLTVSGAFSVGSGSYLTTAAPSNGAMIEGDTLIGTTLNNGSKLRVAGNSYIHGKADIGLVDILSSATSSAVTASCRVRTAVEMRGYEITMSALSPTSGTITIPNMYAFRTNQPNVQLSVTVTNSYGLYVSRTDDPVSGGVVVNKYGIIVEDAAGPVGIGVAAPVEKLEVNGAIKTAAPTTGTAAAWKLGTRVAAAVVLDTTQYIEVEVGGTFYKLAIVT